MIKMEYQYFYDKSTLQIDGVYVNSKTNSAKFKDTTVYVEVNVTDPGYVVSRDHKVILDVQGKVIDTELSVNPIQPEPTVFMPHNPAYGTITAIDITKVKPLRIKIVYQGKEFLYDCYVTQDLKDLYTAGNLNVGDWVTMIFGFGSEEHALAQQKVYKTW